jgi:hypothetical protein
MVKRSNRHVWAGVGFVGAAIAIAGAIYFGMKAINQSNPDAPLLTNTTQATKPSGDSAAPEIKLAKRVIDGACQLGTCYWTRVESQSVVADKPEGRLLRLVASDGEHTFANGGSDHAKPPADMEWGSQTTSYILCSKRMPMFIDTDGDVTLIKSWGTASVADTNAWLLWSGICQINSDKGLPSEEDMKLYQAAIDSKRFADPKVIFGSLPTYPSWLIGKWGWNVDDPQCGDSFTGFRTNHTLDHYETGGRWMVVGKRLWTAWDAYSDDEASTDSDALERQDANHLLMDAEPYFRCASQG